MYRYNNQMGLMTNSVNYIHDTYFITLMQKFCKSNIATKQFSSLICSCLSRNCIEMCLTVDKRSHVKYAVILPSPTRQLWTHLNQNAKKATWFDTQPQVQVDCSACH